MNFLGNLANKKTSMEELTQLWQKRDMASLIKLINTSDPKTQKNAAKLALSLMDKSGDPALLTALQKNFSNEELVNLWFEDWSALVATSGKDKLYVIYKKIGPPAIDLLLQKLNAPEIKANPVIVYGRLITLLGNLGDSRALQPIFDIFMSSKPPLRGDCSRALANLYNANKNDFMIFYNTLSDVQKGAVEITIWLVDKSFCYEHVSSYQAAYPDAPK